MKKFLLPLVSLALFTLSGAAISAPVAVNLQASNQRTSSGTLATLIWETCPPPVPPANYVAPCINPNLNPANNDWVVNNGVAGSTAIWTWDAATGVLASTGVFWSTSYISSNPQGQPVISDRVEDLTIDTLNRVTTATNYQCIEGTFLASVGANGCGNYDTGVNFANNSSVQYNVGGNALCVRRTLGGDDISAGNPRGMTNFNGSTGCDPTEGAFVEYTIAQDDTATGGQLRLSNDFWSTTCYTGLSAHPECAGATWLTFSAVPLPPTAWLLATGIAGIGGRRLLRRKAIA